MPTKSLITHPNRIAFLFLCAFLYTPWMQANSLAKTYKAETKAVLEALQKKGVAHVGCQDLPTHACHSPTDLMKKLENLEFIEVSDFEKPEDATRWTAFYSLNGDKVYLNSSIPHDSETIGLIGFHELLGTLGVQESEFLITLSVERLLNTPHPLAKNEMAALKKQIKYNSIQAPVATEISKSNTKLSTGGGTVIGGGGDGETLRQRILFSRYFAESAKKSFQKSFSASLMTRMSIEVVDNQNEIIYKMAPHDLSGWPRHILVPRKLTRMPPLGDKLAPNRALEDIGNYFSTILRGFFPHFNQDLTYTLYYSPEHETYFSYPDDTTSIHPAAVKNYWRLLQKRFCPFEGHCQKANL